MNESPSPWLLLAPIVAVIIIIIVGNLYPGEAPVIERTVYVDTPSGKVLCIKGSRGNLDCDWGGTR